MQGELGCPSSWFTIRMPPKILRKQLHILQKYDLRMRDWQVPKSSQWHGFNIEARQEAHRRVVLGIFRIRSCSHCWKYLLLKRWVIILYGDREDLQLFSSLQVSQHACFGSLSNKTRGNEASGPYVSTKYGAVSVVLRTGASVVGARR